MLNPEIRGGEQTEVVSEMEMGWSGARQPWKASRDVRYAICDMPGYDMSGRQVRVSEVRVAGSDAVTAVTTLERSFLFPRLPRLRRLEKRPVIPILESD